MFMNMWQVTLKSVHARESYSPDKTNPDAQMDVWTEQFYTPPSWHKKAYIEHFSLNDI